LRTELKSKNAPIVKKEEPIMGTIQGTEARLVQPNQKRQTGMQKAPIKAGGNLFSGLISPFSLNCGSWIFHRYKKKGGRTTKPPLRNR
jgi:hypothetical protein